MDGPYVDGVAPGWRTWKAEADGGVITYLEGSEEEYPGLGTSIQDGDTKGDVRYQIMVGTGAPDKPFRGGMWRKWSNVMPGHQYQVQMSLRVSMENLNDEDWNLSVFIAANEGDNTDLTIDQLAGKQKLPHENAGHPAFGQVVSLNAASYRSKYGRWTHIESGRPAPGNTLLEKTLSLPDLNVHDRGTVRVPEGCSSVTMWIRFEGVSSCATVGVDNITIRDVTRLHWKREWE